MQDVDFDRYAQLVGRRWPRRGALAAVLSAVLATGENAGTAKKKKRDPSSIADRRRRKAKQRDSKKRKKKSSRDRKESFSRDCRRFVISAGPDRDDKFKHIDDDVLIELIPKGEKGGAKVILEDDNGSPNGDDGKHLKANPFTAKVGDRIHIVARNAVVGGCELDEVWIHCIDGRGGGVKLLDRFTPEECSANANRVGVFLDETIRIKNK